MSGRPDAAAPRQRPVRVCIVAPSLDMVGGQSVQASRLVERLGRTGALEVRFLPVNPRLPGPLRYLQRVKYLRTVVTSVAYVASLVRAVRRADVVHAFSASYYSYLLAPLPALVAARLAGRATILNYRSGEAPDHLARWPRSRRTMRLADAIVAPSGYLVDVFARFGLPAVAIHNVVDLDGIPYRRRATPRPRFLANRNMEAHYNVACVVRAFARIQAEVPEATLVVAGDGPERPAVEALARDLGLRGVTFLGRVAPGEMGRLYDEADVYLMSPNLDNMPGSIIECYAAGLPIVTTRAGGIPYILTHDETGLMVDCDDDAAMAASALRLLREPGLAARLADRARAVCEERYVWTAVRASWEQLYARVSAARRPRQAATVSMESAPAARGGA